AEWVTLVEAYAKKTPGLVATVGKLQVEGGAYNVVPGEVHASLDVRHADDSVRAAAERCLRRKAEAVAQPRSVTCTWQERTSTPATPMNDEIVTELLAAARAG